jgi:hypothetical protein
MEGFYTAMAILGMFILRLGIPVVITGAVLYGLRKLDARWEAEALALAKSQKKREEVELRPIEPPCWVLRQCPERIYRSCPAFLHSEQPCWQARRQAEGILPATCFQCTQFSLRKPTHELVN